MTLSEFIKKSNIDSKLIRSVVRSMYGWESFKESAIDIVNNGANCGFGKFIYYYDTVKFTKRNKVSIIGLCKEMDQQIENVGLINFICSFNCMKDSNYDEVAKAIYSGKGEEVTKVYNALAWFALEEVCRSYSDLTYEN